MRRRPVDFRRPVRRRFPNVLWWVLCGVAVLLFIFVLSKGSQIESRPTIPQVKQRSEFCFFLIHLFGALDFSLFDCRENVGKWGKLFNIEYWELGFWVILEFEGTNYLIGLWVILVFGLIGVSFFNSRECEMDVIAVTKPGLSFRRVEIQSFRFNAAASVIVTEVGFWKQLRLQYY